MTNDIKGDFSEAQKPVCIECQHVIVGSDGFRLYNLESSGPWCGAITRKKVNDNVAGGITYVGDRRERYPGARRSNPHPLCYDINEEGQCQIFAKRPSEAPRKGILARILGR